MLFRNIINIENTLILLLLLSGYVSMFSQNIMLLVLAIFLNVVYFCRNSKNFYEKGIFFLIFFLPFYSWIRVAIVHEGFSLFSPIFNSIRDFIILLMFFRSLGRREITLVKSDYVWLLFGCVWFYGLFLTFLFRYPTLGLSGVHLSVIPALLYLTVAYSKEQFDYSKIGHVFLKVSFVVALLGLVSYVLKPPYFQTLFALSGCQIDASDYIRLVSLFLTPNVCGCYLSIAFCVALYYFISEERYFYLIPIVISLLCVFLTLSRGSWMFLLVTILLSFMFFKFKNFVGLVLVVLLVLLCSVYINDFSFNQSVSMTEHGEKRFLTLFDFSNESSFGRMGNWIDTIDMLLNQPTGFGIGVGTTAQISLGNVADVKVIDGFWMKTIAETGLMGLFYCLFFVGWCISKVVTSLRLENSKCGLLPLLICSGFFVQSFGSNPFDFISVAPFFWIVIGLASRKVNDKILIE